MFDSRMIAVLIGSTENAFQLMATPVVPGVPQEGASVRPRVGVTGCVTFSGTCTGAVGFHASLAAARAIAGAMLGVEPDEIHDELSDAIGEMTNLIAGSFRTRMADESGAWALSTPSVTMEGDRRRTCADAGDRVLCPFRFRDEDVFVELVVTGTDPDEPRASGSGRGRSAGGLYADRGLTARH